MESPIKERRPVDPSVTERFLLRHDDVVSVSAWLNRDTMVARVTVTEEATVCERDLRCACHKAIGLQHTPTVILLDRSRRKAA